MRLLSEEQFVILAEPVLFHCGSFVHKKDGVQYIFLFKVKPPCKNEFPNHY